jgi:hypothetical protein
MTVDSSNATAIVEQWRSLHGVPDAPPKSDRVDGYPHRVWNDAKGRAVIEEYVITGAGHGTPLSTLGVDHGETVGPYMLEAGISSTQHSLRFWGIAAARGKAARAAMEEQPSKTPESNTVLHGPARRHARGRSQVGGIQKTIEDALRTAGLLRR